MGRALWVDIFLASVPLQPSAYTGPYRALFPSCVRRSLFRCCCCCVLVSWVLSWVLCFIHWFPFFVRSGCPLHLLTNKPTARPRQCARLVFLNIVPCSCSQACPVSLLLLLPLLERVRPFWRRCLHVESRTIASRFDARGQGSGETDSDIPHASVGKGGRLCSYVSMPFQASHTRDHGWEGAQCAYLNMKVHRVRWGSAEKAVLLCVATVYGWVGSIDNQLTDQPTVQRLARVASAPRARYGGRCSYMLYTCTRLHSVPHPTRGKVPSVRFMKCESDATHTDHVACQFRAGVSTKLERCEAVFSSL